MRPSWILKIPKRRPSWIFQKGGHLRFFQIVFRSKKIAKQSCRYMKLKKGGHLGFSKFQKGGHLGFFQILFGSKNVAKQSCRSMKFQKRRPSWIFQNSKKAAILDFFKSCLDPKMLLNKVVDL